LQDAVTIPLSVAGTAVETSDFAALERTVTLAAGVSRAFIDILPIDNAQFAGSKTVTLTLEAGSGYRLSFARAATVRILDDEPPLPRQADLVLRAGGRRVGADIYETSSPLIPLTQTLTRPTRAGTTIATQLEITHRGTEPAEFILRGAPSATGFLIRYLDRVTDVTAAASTGGTDGGYQFSLQPGERKVIAMRITTTAEAPPGFVQRLPVDLREASADPALAIPDAAEVMVMRR
jgi:hypothetical protein